MSTFLLTLNGNFVNNSGNATSGSGGVTITGAATTQSIDGFTTTGAVSMTKTGGTATLMGNVNGAGLTINGAGGGVLNLGSGLTHTFTGIVTLTAGTLNGGSSTLNENMVSVNAWSGTGTVFSAGTGTVIFGAAGAQTLSATATTFYNLSIQGSGIKALGSATTVGNNLSSAERHACRRRFPDHRQWNRDFECCQWSYLADRSRHCYYRNLSDSYLLLPHITLSATSTVNYNAITGTTQNVAGTVGSVGPSTYGHLTITGASGTKTLTGAITVAGNLTIATAGETFADGGFTITVNGNVTNNATHSGAGKILLSGGSGFSYSNRNNRYIWKP